mgnify:CR=1 FL=1
MEQRRNDVVAALSKLDLKEDSAESKIISGWMISDRKSGDNKELDTQKNYIESVKKSIPGANYITVDEWCVRIHNLPSNTTVCTAKSS